MQSSKNNNNQNELDELRRFVERISMILEPKFDYVRRDARQLQRRYRFGYWSKHPEPEDDATDSYNVLANKIIKMSSRIFDEKRMWLLIKIEYDDNIWTVFRDNDRYGGKSIHGDSLKNLFSTVKERYEQTEPRYWEKVDE